MANALSEMNGSYMDAQLNGKSHAEAPVNGADSNNGFNGYMTPEEFVGTPVFHAQMDAIARGMKREDALNRVYGKAKKVQNHDPIAANRLVKKTFQELGLA